ncbi:MAG TPA: hypothetical protein QGF58_23455 [Myxococcota bacterium]|nr:hypothetical protein [Myxococcota bacterium]
MLLLFSCAQTVPTDRVEPTFIYVTVLAEDLGTAESPLPFSSETALLPVRVETLDVDGDPYPHTGDLVVKVRPGRLDQAQWVTVTDGVYEGEIAFGNGFASTRVWFSDEGDKDAESQRQPSFATGVSDPPLWYALPTLSEINTIDDVESNQLEGEFTEVRAIDREVRVTAVGTNGFWITDTADDVGSYNNLFVYTFSRPRDEVVLGARLTLLTGANQEYLGTTQLSFPTYEVADEETGEVPDPATLSASDCADLAVLEGHESSVVRFEDLQVPSTFGPGDGDYEDWVEYGQWPVGDCLYVDNSVTIPDFVPQAGQDIAYVQGMLNQVFDKWIVLPREADDLAPAAGGPPSPPPRMPPAPGELPHSHAPSEPCLP